MAPVEDQFTLSFDSVAEFDRAFERKGPDTGIFLPTTRPLGVGRKVSFITSVKTVGTPVVLEGTVIWRRARAGRPDMPAGIFVNLVARDRARLDALVRYMSAAHGRRDRRRHQRYPVSLPATYRTSKGEHDSVTRNISRGGAFLRCMGPLLTVGARLTLVIYLEGERGRGTALEAQVAWIDYFEETQGMGVQFAQKRAQLKKVERFVGRLEKNRKNHSSLESV